VREPGQSAEALAQAAAVPAATVLAAGARAWVATAEAPALAPGQGLLMRAAPAAVWELVARAAVWELAAREERAAAVEPTAQAREERAAAAEPTARALEERAVALAATPQAARAGRVGTRHNRRA